MQRLPSGQVIMCPIASQSLSYFKIVSVFQTSLEWVPGGLLGSKAVGCGIGPITHCA